MSPSLYKQMMKSNFKSIMSFGMASAVYVILMTSLFPMISDNIDKIQELTEIYPDSLMKAFGLESFGTYGEFISAEYYGLFFLFILGIFSVMTAIQLIAKLVDRGSMAYLLSTKVSRAQVAITQISVLITGLIIIIFLNFAGGYAAGELLIDDQYAIAMGDFFQINFVGFLLFFAVGGYSILFSSLFNDEKMAFAAAGGVTFLFYALDMAGKIVSDLEWLRNLSIFSLYEPAKIAKGDVNVVLVSLILFGLGLLMYIATVLVFRRRNLPL
ncbi:ABC transporter permease subunit [Guptibacillus algicola]|uniref:ABC transporter permease subunit n=1 Tax=Guptibacillus algicola TaxID=225844 RepID=UPI001CD75C0C|nr:ABC transporter permease subunit [Alkalihalobacillus algicola]MCA0988441.1 ABC transporter permease [Alkalihalobacillus algicola]